MHSGTIIFCFLWTISQLSLSLVVQQAHRFYFNLPNRSVTEEYRHRGYIVGQNISSITIVIELNKYAQTTLVGTEVYYRVQTPLIRTVLGWNDYQQCYVLEKLRPLGDGGKLGNYSYRQSALPSLQETVVVGNLQFPGTIYILDITSYRQDGSWRRAIFEASTQSVLPENPPIIGVGCFHVISVNSTGRKVAIYWQHVQHVTDSMMEVEVFAFETYRLFRPVFMGISPIGYGSMVIDISLIRHTFYLRSINEVGRSRTPSIFEVPAQEDILPALETRITSSGLDKMSVTWEPAKNTNVTNYTLCWYDTREGGKGLLMQNLTYHERGVVGFDIKADRSVNLAMSVNTDTGSSGLIPVLYKKWPFELS